MRTKAISWLIALLPLLSVCRSPIPGVDMGTLLSIVIAIMFIVSDKVILAKKKNVISYFLLYIIFITSINSLFFDANAYPEYVTTTTTFLRLGKLVIVLGIFFSIDNIKYVDINKSTNAISKLIILNTGLILIQRITYQFSGIILRNPLSIFATDEAYNSSDYTMLVGSNLRPSGLFFEPSHYAQYCMLYLCYLLFSKKRVDIKMIIVVSVGIIVTGSGMGILMLLGILLVFLIIRFNKNTVTTVIYSASLIVIVLIMSRLPFVQAMLYRITDGSRTGGNAIEARIGKGYTIFQNLDIFNKLFGFGYGRVPNNVYLNGVTYLLNTLGIIGILFFIIVLVKLFIKVPVWGRWTICCFIALMPGAQLFSPSSLVFFLGLPLAASYKSEAQLTASYKSEVQLAASYLSDDNDKHE